VLKARFRGYFVPPRPEKNAVEGQRMADAFIEERRSALERYLSTLAAHPTIAASEVGSFIHSFIHHHQLIQLNQLNQLNQSM
jgi:hypothetical protein